MPKAFLITHPEATGPLSVSPYVGVSGLVPLSCSKAECMLKMALANLWDEGTISNMKIKAYLLGVFLRRK